MEFVVDNIKQVENPISELVEIAEKLKKNGEDVLNLGIGDPARYMKTPKFIISAYIEALKTGRTFYEDWDGNIKLKNSVKVRYHDLYNVEYSEDDIILTQGVSEALQFTNTSILKKGETALIIAPFFTQYLPNIVMEGAVPIFGYHDFSKDWDIDIESIENALKLYKKNKPKYILVTNPNNPTGTVPSEKSLKEVVELAKDNDIFLISDEIYDELLFNNANFTSMSKVAKNTPYMILNGASKNLFATGFRVGFCIIPEDDKKSTELKQAVSMLANSRLSANTPAEYAVAEGVSNKAERKKFLSDVLPRIQKTSNFAHKLCNESNFLEAVKPNSAFYIFPRINLDSLKIKNDKEFTELLLKEEHLQTIRGSGFGMNGFIRLVTLPKEEIIEDAFSRIERFCKKHKK